MAHKFKIGDRVETPSSGSGTVVHIREDDFVGVEYDAKTPVGHSCNGHCKFNHGWYYFPKELKPLPVKQELHFVRKGNVVHAILKDGDKTTRTKATCSPEDEFDFVKGVEIASSRLFGKPLCLKEDKKPEPVKIKKYHRYILKPYDDVADHRGISEHTWKGIKWVMVVEEPAPNRSLTIVDNDNVIWYISADSILTPEGVKNKPRMNSVVLSDGLLKSNFKVIFQK